MQSQLSGCRFSFDGKKKVMGNTTVEKQIGQWGWLFHLDRILRGEATQPSAIRKGDIQIPLFGIAFLVLSLIHI